MAAYPGAGGYWLVAERNKVHGDGAALYHGSAFGVASARVVGMAATPDGLGYWALAAANGAVYGYGDAAVHGSAVASKPKPIVGIAG